MNGIRIGLTGMIGSGKTTALTQFARQGWHSVRTDELAREEMEKPDVRDQLRKRWGDKIFRSGSLIDRRAVAEIVFSNTAELDWLESILHPKVRKRWEHMIEVDPENDIVVEIPLLFEKNLASRFDSVVCLHCPEPLQSSRLLARGLSAEDYEARKLRQFSACEKESRAEFVLSNCGTIAFLETQVIRLSETLRKRWNQKHE